MADQEVNPPLEELRPGTPLFMQAGMVTIVALTFGRDSRDYAWCLFVRKHWRTPYVVATVDAHTLNFREWRAGRYAMSIQEAMHVYLDAMPVD